MMISRVQKFRFKRKRPVRASSVRVEDEADINFPSAEQTSAPDAASSLENLPSARFNSPTREASLVNVFDNASNENDEFMNNDSDEPMPNNSQKQNKNNNSANVIRQWALRHNISHAASRDLLMSLKLIGVNDLPLDPRTLLQTPRTADIQQMGSGEFCHFNLRTIIYKQIKKYDIKNEEINLTINVDGLPIYKSSNYSLWLLCGYIDHTNQTPFVISVYGGLTKPDSSNDFLSAFVNNMIDIRDNGIEFNNKLYSVTIKNMIFDSPARSFVLYTKGHTGYYACSKCIVAGRYISNKVTFPDTSSELRTDLGFKNRTYPKHHKGKSILENLNIGMVSQVPLDYLHVLLLGVIKRIVFIWIDGPVPFKLSSSVINRINQRIYLLVKYVPSEFSRKPRKLNEYKRWKGTEFRFFVVYSSLVLLYDLIDKDLVSFMSLLFISIRILLRNSTQSDIAYSNELLKYCVDNFGELFGVSQITYNVHNLIHLAKNVTDHGPLDNTSAFPFENFMSSIKRVIRRPNGVLAQIYNRCAELNEFSEDDVPEIDENKMYKKIDDKYYRLKYNKSIYSNLNNNCGAILKNGTFIKILYFTKHENDMKVYYNKLLPKQGIFEDMLIYNENHKYGLYPCSISQYVDSCKISNILGKTCLFPIFHKPNAMVAIPLINSLYN